MTDQSDQVLRHRDYLPFAEEYHAAGWVPENPPHDRKLFTGQERDFETGLDYFHARQLRVDLGRFTTPDPLTDLAWTDGTLGATNAYGYVQSNPLGFIDPTGAFGDGTDHQGRADPCDTLSPIPCFRSGNGSFDPAQVEASFQEFVFTHVYIDPHPIPQIGPERGGAGGAGGGNPQAQTTSPQDQCTESVIGAAILNGVGTALGVGIPGANPAGDVAGIIKDAARNPAIRAGAGVMAAQIGGAILTRQGAMRLATLISEDLVPGVGWAAATYLAYSAISDGVQYYRENIGTCGR